MKDLVMLPILLLLALSTPLAAQTSGEVYRDRSSGRRVHVVRVDSTRVYYRNLDTASVLRTTFARGYTLEQPPAPAPGDTTIPPTPPPDTPPPPLVAPTMQRTLARLDAFNLGLDIVWLPVPGASEYEFRSYYGTGANVPWQRTNAIAAQTRLPRNEGKLYNTCVRAVGGPESCSNARGPAVDSVSILIDSTSMAIGSVSKVCIYGWHRGRIMTGTKPRVTSSDTTVMRFDADTSAAALAECLARYTADRIWPIP